VRIVTGCNLIVTECTLFEAGYTLIVIDCKKFEVPDVGLKLIIARLNAIYLVVFYGKYSS